MHTFWCRKFFKKNLVSAQNLENKGSEFFLPARSMVLKVVTGKILETLELASRKCFFLRYIPDTQWLTDRSVVTNRRISGAG